MTHLICFLLAMLSLTAGAAVEADFTALVVGVHDGDTITVYDGVRPQIKVRLAEIDAPELRQPYGSAAKGALSAMVFQKKVKISPTGRDRNKRLIAHIASDGRGINAALVRAGAAWRFEKYSKS